MCSASHRVSPKQTEINFFETSTKNWFLVGAGPTPSNRLKALLRLRVCFFPSTVLLAHELSVYVASQYNMLDKGSGKRRRRNNKGEEEYREQVQHFDKPTKKREKTYFVSESTVDSMSNSSKTSFTTILI